MPKMKSKSGAAKRFKVRGSGSIKRGYLGVSVQELSINMDKSRVKNDFMIF